MNNKKLFEVQLGAFIFNDKNQLLILKNRRGTWGIVGGHPEYNETPQQCLLREIKEETDIKAELAGYFDAEIKNKKFILLYVAKYISGKIKLSNEHSDWRWIELKNLDNYNLTFRQLKKDAERAIKIFFSANSD